MGRIAVFLSGLLFGAGLTLSGMVNPAKVLNFLDIAGAWDPTLIFVMGAGLVVTFFGYRLVLRRSAPLFAKAFKLPTTTGVDAKLVAGALLFGTGWGLTGFCPGPAVAALVFAQWQTWVFVASMAAGTVLVRIWLRRGSAPAQAALQVEG